MSNIKVGTLNVLNKGNFDERYKIISESKELSQLDILCVQEMVDEELFHSHLKPLGFEYYEYSEKMLDNRGNKTNSIGILSKTPLKDEGQDYTMGEHLGNIFGRSTTIDGITFNVFTIHASWGTMNEHKRLKQSEIIDSYAEELETRNPNSISIYCGDFNSDEDNRSIRFLKGRDLNSTNDKSTLWLDAYGVAGNENFWVTNDHSTNKLGRQTALWAGIKKTEYLPKRRIDYIFVKGWCYGRNGFPLSYHYLTHPNGEELSDHNGIYSELLITSDE